MTKPLLLSRPARLGYWQSQEPCPPADNLLTALRQLRTPLFLCRTQTGLVLYQNGQAELNRPEPTETAQELIGYAPASPPEQCGDARFLADHGLRYPMVAGSMAKGISSPEMVIAMGRAGMLGFFGAAGLPVDEVEGKIRFIQQQLNGLPYGVNLIHSPNEPDLEQALVECYLRLNVHLIEASAFLRLTAPVVAYRLQGIHRDSQGEIITPNRIMAKVSREEIARQFLSPPPEALVRQLLAQGHITAQQAELARLIPMADDVTAEADSGGHTDNRPALALLPTIMAVRDQLQQQYGYARVPRIGLGGGIATPQAAAAAFTLGAAYLVTGSVNQACVESGTSDMVRTMLAEARQADIAMAPAADMFEMGVDVQVLKRGTMFSMRAARLYELYRGYDSLEQIPAEERAKLEKTFFRTTLDEVWAATRAYFLQRDPRQVERAEQDPKHRMALIFRSYLGQATHWANAGEQSRKMDFQIWCGPAMAAFNAWTKGSFLAKPEQRQVVTVNLNLLLGAVIWIRSRMLGQGFDQLTRQMKQSFHVPPLTPEQIKESLRD